MGAEIDKNLIMEYVSSVKESYPAKKMLLLNTILFNDYIKKNTIKTKEDVKELVTVCEITEESVVKPISVNTGNKHDIIRFIEKATENTSITINEDLIDEFVATAKSDSDAKEVLSLNPDFFGKYVQIHKISTKKDLEELFKLSEISTRTRQVKIPNIFNKTDREIWYKTENFEKYGIPKGQLEQIILEEQEKTEKDIQSVRITKEYSKPQELEKNQK